MNIEKIKVKKIYEDAKVPKLGSTFAAGSDLHAYIKDPNHIGLISINPHETKFIHTGISLEIPNGLVGLVFARSGLSCKNGLAPANKVGVIDSDYRGEIMVALHNHSNTSVYIEHETRIAQIVFIPYVSPIFEEVAELSDTDRGEGGFGSSGIK